jgi:hypothetical protein
MQTHNLIFSKKSHYLLKLKAQQINITDRLREPALLHTNAKASSTRDASPLPPPATLISSTRLRRPRADLLPHHPSPPLRLSSPSTCCVPGVSGHS